MRTAHLVETMCDKNRIHVSEQTADLLTVAGKRHWLDQRNNTTPLPPTTTTSDLKTFWLTIRAAGGGGSVASATERQALTEKESEDESQEGDSHDGDRTDDEDDEDAQEEELMHLQDMPALDPVTIKLVDWNCEQLTRLLKQIVAHREFTEQRHRPTMAASTTTANVHEMARSIGNGIIPAEEVVEIIQLPGFEREVAVGLDISSVKLSREVTGQVCPAAVCAPLIRNVGL
jgi:hypothetical protein